MAQRDSQWQNELATRPLTTALLDSSESEGDILRFEWAILERPQGSTQRLLPDAGEQSPRLFLDLMGAYQVQLTVHGESHSGERCQDTDMVEITAAYENGLHIQLVWDTPADDDQTDTDGTDVDLHYLHPNGEWNAAPWDIFWRNPTANWGGQHDTTDDPSLVIDDTDGAGPEQIRHSNLEDIEYTVGVYYHADANMGPSFATVRIFDAGNLLAEYSDYRMPRDGHFWEVATIDGLSRAVTAVSRGHNGFPDNL